MCWGDGGPCARAPLTAALFPQRLPSGKVGFSKAMSNKWIRVDKSAADGPRVFRVVSPCWRAVGQLVGQAGPWPSGSLTPIPVAGGQRGG